MKALAQRHRVLQIESLWAKLRWPEAFRLIQIGVEKLRTNNPSYRSNSQ